MIAFLSTILVISSFTLFFIELHIGKALLPIYGGSPATWNACLVFFQSMLCLGYIVSHALCKRGSALIQYFLFLGALLTSYLSLPFHIPERAYLGSGGLDTVLFVLSDLFSSLAIPFITLSIAAPLLQHWVFRWSQGRKDPYVLYTASNVGSFLGLLCFPFVIEPTVPLAVQGTVIKNTYLVIFILSLLSMWKWGNNSNAPGRVNTPTDQRSSKTGIYFKWVALSALPSSLLMGVTSHISSNIAPLPLLWMAPLLMYFLTYSLAFSERLKIPLSFLFRLSAFGILVVFASFILQADGMLTLMIPLHLLSFFSVILLCHRKLFLLRPDPQELTKYYAALSLGGTFGGIVTTLGAPLLFSDTYEYGLAYLLVLPLCSEQPSRKKSSSRKAQLVVLYLLFIVTLYYFFQSYAHIRLLTALSVTPLFLYFYSLSKNARLFSALLGTTWLLFIFVPNGKGGSLIQKRNFFGIFRVTESDNFRSLIHGDTAHGGEILSERERCIPSAYYGGKESELGRYLDFLFRTHEPQNIGLIGVGTGTLLCYGEPKQHWYLFEINPAVFETASDSDMFTFLSNNQAGEVSSFIGDGRVQLKNLPASHLQLLMIDAFNSDSIPLHLLTREAFSLYNQVLTEDGVILLHISNRYFDLRQTVANLSDTVGKKTYVLVSAEEGNPHSYPAQWAVIGKANVVQEGLLKALGAELIIGDKEKAWSDDFSDVVSVLR